MAGLLGHAAHQAVEDGHLVAPEAKIFGQLDVPGFELELTSILAKQLPPRSYTSAASKTRI